MKVDASAPSAKPSGPQAVYAATLRGDPSHVVGLSARTHRLPMRLSRHTADMGDVALLVHCIGATLDIGCGPGRMSQGLVARGACVLGIAASAAMTVDRLVECEGRWDAVLGKEEW